LVLPDGVVRNSTKHLPQLIIPDSHPAIEFENVSFTYDNRTQIFKDVNLRVPFGKKAALVGPSGSG
jgi:ABC-type multidrug transport system fused ATPase/permease subunit